MKKRSMVYCESTLACRVAFPRRSCLLNLSPEKCFDLLIKKCQNVPRVEINVGRKKPRSLYHHECITGSSSLPEWGNGRDVETISKRIISHILRTLTASSGRLEVTYADVLRELERLRVEMKTRAACRNGSSSSSSIPSCQQP